jgi:tetratricopeptide (TPR) repeat protein
LYIFFDDFLDIIVGKVMKNIFLVLIIFLAFFLAALFITQIGGFLIGFVSLVSLFILLVYIVTNSYRKVIFKDEYQQIYYVGRKYDDNILTERLERWNDSRYSLGGDKKSEHLNKLIYKLEKRIRKSYKKAKYQDALVIIEQISKIVQENYESSHPFFTITLTNTGRLHHEIGNYSEARYYLEKALEVRKELLGENHLDVARSMTNLGKLYQEIGNYAEAESLFAKSLEIKQNFPDKYHIFSYTKNIRTAIDYTYFGYLYYENGEYDKAEEYYNKAIKTWKSYQNYKMYPLESAATLNNLGILYQEIGKLRDAEIYLEKGLEIRKKVLGENHLEVARSMANLGKLYHEMENYDKAKLLYETSLNIISLNIGKDTIYFAALLTHLGKLYHDQVNYSEAESVQKESLNTLQKLQGINPLHIARSMTNLGKLYHEIGNYREAEIYLEKGLEIREKLLGEDHLDSAQSKYNLAEVYLNIGDYSKADQYYNQALEIRLKIFSRLKDTPEGLNNLANIHLQLGNKAEAIKLYKRSLGSWKEIGQKKSSGYATALNKLGELYYELGDFSKSEKYYKKALEIRQLIFSDTSSPIAQSMNNLALLFHKTHEYVEAEEYYNQALNILKKVFGEKNINLAITLNNLAILYAKTQRQDKAIELLKDVITIEDELIGQVFSIGSERQRMAFLNIINKNFHNFLSLTNQFFSNSKEEIKYAINLTIRRKGIGAEALTATRDAILSGRYPEMESKLLELNIIRKQIARKTLDGKDEYETLDTHNKILAEWNNKKEKLEEKLANHIPEIKLEQKLNATSLETINKFLSRDVVLIELIKYNFTDFSNQNNNDETIKRSHYLAFVIYDNSKNNIQMFDLGDSELIDEMINNFRNTVTGENQNRNLIPVGSYPMSANSNSTYIDELRIALSPLLKAFRNHKRIFISPDGDFTKFPFELLRFDSSDRYILEDYLISYVSTSRDLITFGNSSIGIGPLNNSLVIADPDFDLSMSDISSNNIPSSNVFANSKSIISSQDKPNFRQSRDLDPRSLNFNRLKGTREEGQLVADLIGVSPCMDQKVLESDIKSYTSPNILHIATHGFFLPNQKNYDNNANTTFLGKIETKTLTRLSADHQVDNPMLRSGLALAGVNTWLKNRPLIKEAEDGLLTADDVAGWNLSNTELVVLSACETGLGDIVTGEGVFGLRRAFVLAGAQTLVMSLWKVPDEQTKQLMIGFYKRLLEGKPRAEALREAQLAMKEKYPDPYYWGAFICQGNPSNMTVI